MIVTTRIHQISAKKPLYSHLCLQSVSRLRLQSDFIANLLTRAGGAFSLFVYHEYKTMCHRRTRLSSRHCLRPVLNLLLLSSPSVTCGIGSHCGLVDGLELVHNNDTHWCAYVT